jgi:uncharacterized membrane protein YfcA
VPDLPLTSWLLLGAAVLLVGFGKTAIGGVASISVAVFAAVLPAKESTGTLLPLLLVGDVVAVLVYRRHANWRLLWRLFPWVAVGTVIGVFFVAHVDDTVMRRSIGVVLLVLVALQLAGRGGRLQRLAARQERSAAGRGAVSAVVGIAAGVLTMVANSAGAVMTLYLLLSGTLMLEFLGTGAWFFLIVNLFKVPFSAGLGLIDRSALALDLALAPLVLLGGVIGILAVRRLGQQQFEWAALTLVGVAALPLLR